MDNTRSKQEVNWARGTVLAGLGAAVILCGGGNHPDLLFYAWVPQAFLLIVMAMIGARPAAIGGAAFALTVFLVFFNWWVHKYAANDGLAWLIYVFSLPGGLVACIVVARRLNRFDGRAPLDAGLAAATWVISGIAVNYLAWYAFMA